MLSADPVFQEFHGRDVAERGMLPPPVVERFDVVEQVGLCRSPRAVAGTMHPNELGQVLTCHFYLA